MASAVRSFLVFVRPLLVSFVPCAISSRPSLGPLPWLLFFFLSSLGALPESPFASSHLFLIPASFSLCPRSSTSSTPPPPSLSLYLLTYITMRSVLLSSLWAAAAAASSCSSDCPSINLSALQGVLSADADIFTAGSFGYNMTAARWSVLDAPVSQIVVVPATAADVQATVS